MREKIKEFFRIINSNEETTFEKSRNEQIIEGVVSALLGGVSLVLSIINLVTAKYLMMASTLLLFIVFSLSSLILLKFKKKKLAEILITAVILVVFTYYAFHGQNDGFAVLWILLAPAIGTLFFSFKRGIIVSTYYLVLLIVIFYLPFIFPGLKNVFPAYRDEVPGYYEQFRIRFPVLYISSFVVSVFLNSQKIYYSKIAEKNSVQDAMTSLRNRRYYNDYTQSLGMSNKVDNDFTIISIDINNLKNINDMLGHNFGDEAIIKTSEILTTVFKDVTSHIYRTGGDEFSVFFYDKNNDLEEIIKKLSDLASKTKICDQVLSFSIGTVKGREYIDCNLQELLNIAETQMYKAKQQYYEKLNGKRHHSYFH